MSLRHRRQPHSGHLSLINFVTLPTPAPRSTTLRTGKSGMRIRRSSAGLNRCPENFRYCCGFHTIAGTFYSCFGRRQGYYTCRSAGRPNSHQKPASASGKKFSSHGPRPQVQDRRRNRSQYRDRSRYSQGARDRGRTRDRGGAAKGPARQAGAGSPDGRRHRLDPRRARHHAAGCCR